MKKLKACLLLAMIITAFGAIASESQAPRQPSALIKALDDLYRQTPARQTLKKEMSINPETALLESRTSILTVTCDPKSPLLSAAITAFENDQDCAYQYLYMDPSSRDLCSVTTASGYETLHKSGAETWMMCVKNETNPALRDVYALTVDPRGTKVEATIYLITSPRPDLRQAPAPKSGICVIEGKVEDVYADGTKYVYLFIGDSNGAPASRVPIENNKFRFEMQLSEPADAQLYLVGADGKLGGDWTDICLLPGFTTDVILSGGKFLIDNGRDYYDLVQRYRGANSGSGAQNGRLEKMRIAIDNYKNLASLINKQIKELYMGAPYEGREETIHRLNFQLKEIYLNMQHVIDQYSEQALVEE